MQIFLINAMQTFSSVQERQANLLDVGWYVSAGKKDQHTKHATKKVSWIAKVAAIRAKRRERRGHAMRSGGLIKEGSKGNKEMDEVIIDNELAVNNDWNEFIDQPHAMLSEEDQKYKQKLQVSV